MVEFLLEKEKPLTEYFIYSSQELWSSRQRWWLLELPEPFDDFAWIDLSDEAMHTDEGCDSESPLILFELHTTPTPDSPITLSLSNNDLKILKIHKFSASLMLGLLHPCNFVQFKSAGTGCTLNATYTLEKKKDLILLGETHALIKTQPTFPRFDALSTENQACICLKTFDQLRHEVHASILQLQLRLLLNTYVCVPHDDLLQTQWIHFSDYGLFTLVKHFFLFIRTHCLCANAFSYQDALLCLQDSNEKLPYILENHSSLSVQILLLFCDIQNTSDFDFSHNFLLNVKEISDTFTHYVTLFQKFDEINNAKNASLSFCMNLYKIARIILRYTISISPQIHSTAFVASVLATALELFPPDILDDTSFWSSPYIYTMYRGDCLCGHNLGNSENEASWKVNLLDDCLSEAFIDKVREKLKLLTCSSHFHEDIQTYINPHLINPKYLRGFAVQKDQTILYISHNNLSWDWTKRLEVLFQYKQKWTLNELEIYLYPLRCMSKLSHYTVPAINDIASRYLLKTNETDTTGHFYYINRRVFI